MLPKARTRFLTILKETVLRSYYKTCDLKNKQADILYLKFISKTKSTDTLEERIYNEVYKEIESTLCAGKYVFNNYCKYLEVKKDLVVKRCDDDCSINELEPDYEKFNAIDTIIYKLLEIINYEILEPSLKILELKDFNELIKEVNKISTFKKSIKEIEEALQKISKDDLDFALCDIRVTEDKFNLRDIAVDMETISDIPFKTT